MRYSPHTLKQMVATLLGTVVLLTGLTTKVALASEQKLCLYQFRKKLYLRAAVCFKELAAKQERAAKGKLNAEQRASIGSLLRNASLAYRKIAKQSKNPQQAYLREQALFQIQKLLTGKYYEDNSQKRLASQLKDKIELEIGYIKLLVVTSDPNAALKLEGGYKFPTKQSKGKEWRLKLRPGSYSLLVQYPKAGLQTKSFQLKPGQGNALFTFRPNLSPKGKGNPKSRASSGRIAGISLVVGGAVLTIVGGVILGVSASTYQGAIDTSEELQQKRKTAPQTLTVDETEELRDKFNNANAQSALGIVLGSSGLIAATIGIVLFLTATKKNPKTKVPPKAPPTARNLLLWRTP